MSTSSILFRLCLAVGLAEPFAAAQAGAMYSDATFNPGDYNVQIYRSVPGATVIPGQSLSLGNPGAAATVNYSTNGLGPTDITVGFFRPTFTYNPSLSGVIQGIDVSLDRYFQPFFNGAPSAVGALSLRTFILQGGSVYQAVESFSPVTGAYTTLSAANLTASDFGLFDFTTGILLPGINPNFAAPIEFGFGIRASTGNVAPNVDTGDLRADNWLVTVRSVPEPSTLALALATLAVLAWGPSRKTSR
jgi:PEP-CTERM motif-containing protein